MPPRVYAGTDMAENAEVELDKNASSHLLKVLRRQAGDALTTFNGDGYDYAATIIAAGKTVTVRIDERRRNHNESPLHITLAQGVSRGDRMDFTLQKSVELGVNEIQPLLTQKSTVRLDADRAEKKHRHWQTIVISACEQSGRSVVPSVHPPVTMTEWLANGADACLVLAPGASTPLSSFNPVSRCTVVVGPESGFSDAEYQQLNTAGAEMVSLGPRVLRTETAAAAAIAVLQSQHGDFR